MLLSPQTYLQKIFFLILSTALSKKNCLMYTKKMYCIFFHPVLFFNFILLPAISLTEQREYFFYSENEPLFYVHSLLLLAVHIASEMHTKEFNEEIIFTFHFNYLKVIVMQSTV